MDTPNKIVVYTTAVCPKCKKLKDYLKSKNVDFETADMGTPESLTELRFHNVFTINAPVLRRGDMFCTDRILFPNGELDTEFIDTIAVEEVV